MRRVIAHVDADAFYASVHLLEDPTLAGKPVIVAGSGLRSIVTTASYEARKYGVGSAQPASQARRLCPHAVFLTPDFPLYREYSRRAMTVMEQFADTIEPLSLDEAYLEIGNAASPVRAMREMVAQIRKQTGLQYSVGIGPNKLCAKVLSDHRKPGAFNVASREQCCELFAASPPRLLPGIGPKTADTLAGMGICSVRDVREAGPGVLERAFGPRRGAELRARARFEHDGAVTARRDPKSQSEETTFENDVADIRMLEARMRDLSDELCVRLTRRGLRGRTIGIKVRLADFTTVTRARTLHEYVNDPAAVAQVACELLREYDPDQPVRLLGVRVAAFEHDLPAARPGAESAAWEQLRLPLNVGTGAAVRTDPANAATVSG